MRKKNQKRVLAFLLMLIMTISLAIPNYSPEVSAAATSANFAENRMNNPEFDVNEFGELNAWSKWYPEHGCTLSQDSSYAYYGSNSMKVSNRQYHYSRASYRQWFGDLQYEKEYLVQGAVSASKETTLELYIQVWGYGSADSNNPWPEKNICVDRASVSNGTWAVLKGTFKCTYTNSTTYPGKLDVTFHAGGQAQTIYGVAGADCIQIFVQEAWHNNATCPDVYQDSFILRENTPMGPGPVGHQNGTNTEEDTMNLIANSSFETNHFSSEHNFGTWYSDSATLTQYSEASQSGSHSLKVSNRGTHWSRAQYRIEGAKLDSGREYTLSGSVCSDSAVDLELLVTIYGYGGTNEPYPFKDVILDTCTADIEQWTKLGGRFSIVQTVNPTNTEKNDLNIYYGDQMAVVENVDGLSSVQIQIQEPYNTNATHPNLYLDSFMLKKGTLDIDSAENGSEPAWFTAMTQKLNGEDSNYTASADELAGYQKVFYVSPNGNDGNSGGQKDPFLTLERAKTAVRGIKNSINGDIAVVLREGTYILSNKLCFDEQDSGVNGHDIVWRSYPGEVVKINGGQQITGWGQLPGSDKIWCVGTSLQKADSLYINGVRADIANSGTQPLTLKSYDTTNKRIVVNSSDIASLGSGASILLYQDWQTSIIPIDSKTTSGSNGYIYFNSQVSNLYYRLTHSLLYESKDYMLLDDMSLLDEPGEYYFDKDTKILYYIPREGENMTTAEVYSPKFDGLVSVQGSSITSPAQNLVFEGLVFEYAGFDNKSTLGAYMEYQSTHYFLNDNNDNWPNIDVITGAIHVQNANRVDIERCVIRHGGGNGVNFYHSVNNSNLDGCVITDVSGAGVVSGPCLYKKGDSIFGNPYTPAQPLRMAVRAIDITNNIITWTGRQYKSGCGIANALGYEILIRNNEVGYTSSMGIANGFGWSTNDYVVKENTIAYNDIHHVGMNTKDVAAIYNLNKQQGTIITQNYIHDMQNAGIGRPYGPVVPLYLDEGSDCITVTDNTTLNYYSNSDGNNIIGQRGSANYFFHATGENNIFERNDVINNDVINSAGVGDAYVSITLRKGHQAGTSVIQNVSLGQPRHNIWGEVGMKITPTSDVMISGIGRFYYPNNTGKHQLLIYNAKDGSVVANTWVDMSKGTTDANGFKYGILAQEVLLKGGNAYYVVSTESEDGDYWMNDACEAISSSDFTINGGVTRTSGNWTSYDYMMGPVNLLVKQYLSGHKNAATTEVEDNLLQNSSFETNDFGTEHQFAKWYSNPYVSSTISQVNNYSHSGRYSLKISNRTDATSRVQYREWFGNLTEGKDYILSGYVSASSQTSVELVAVVWGYGGTEEAYPSVVMTLDSGTASGTDWTQLTGKFNISIAQSATEGKNDATITWGGQTQTMTAVTGVDCIEFYIQQTKDVTDYPDLYVDSFRMQKDPVDLIVGGGETKTDAVSVTVVDNMELPTGYVKGKYIFGWTYNGKNQTTFDTNNDPRLYVAEFIDTKMLDVKKQDNSETAEAGATTLNMRFISSVDSTNYDEVGFVFSLTNFEPILGGTTCVSRSTTTVYENLNAAGEPQHVYNVYDEYSAYMYAFEMTKIPATGDGTVIYARAYVKRGNTYVYGATNAITVKK